MTVRHDGRVSAKRTRFWHQARVIGGVVLAGLLVAGAPARAAGPEILVYGDSLMAGYGLARAEGFVPQLQAALDAAGVEARLINASASGDTTQAGLARLDWSLGSDPDGVILGLGANDMLRGVPVATTRANLQAMLERFKAENVPVLLAGMMAQRGLGESYVQAFDALYPDLAARYGAALYPFFLQGVALEPALNQADMLHPNAEGIALIVKAMLPSVVAFVAGLGEVP